MHFSLPVHAFMYVFKLRFNMLKKGSRTGYFSLPHNTVCSRMWATPVESVGVVLNVVLQTVRRIVASRYCLPKHIVGVVAFNMQMTRTGCIVHQIIGSNISFRHIFFLIKWVIINNSNFRDELTYLRHCVIMYFLPNINLEFASFCTMLDPTKHVIKIKLPSPRFNPGIGV